MYVLTIENMTWLRKDYNLDTSGWIQLTALIVLVILSAFFSSCETAFTTLNELKMKGLAEEGDKKASSVMKILSKYSRMLSTILVGNNIVNISASALATTFTIEMFGNYAVGFATGILTILVLIFGEIIPKTWASIRNEKIAYAYAPILKLLMFIMTPIVLIVDVISNGILRLMNIDPANKINDITEREIKTYVDVSHEGGATSSEEREMIYNVYDFSDACAKDIMIPRIDMVTISVDCTYQKLLAVFREFMFTRIPVYEEDPDNIIGIVNMKDFILVQDKAKFSVRSILREAYYTYEFKKTADLMIEMREKAFNVSFVLSEYGNTVGMITMEDLLEEIVGEIRDEYDADEEELIQEMAAGEYLVEGAMKISDINDALDIELASEDYDSIGGLMIEQLERLPYNKEEITLENGYKLKACGIKRNRIQKVLITIKPDEKEELPAENL